MEYRIKWSAQSNINFHGSTAWEEWDDDSSTEAEVADAIGGASRLSVGLEVALQESGFEWDVETR